jgi:hypothetical protein
MPRKCAHLGEKHATGDWVPSRCPPLGTAVSRVEDARRAHDRIVMEGGVVGATGFEPAIFRSQSGRDTRLRYAPDSMANCKLLIANC